jgi:hypothetical protein
LELPIAGVIENMSGFLCPHCGKGTDIFSAGGGERMADEIGIPFLGSIPIDPSFVSRSDSGQSLIDSTVGGESFDAMTMIIDKIMKPVSDN